MKNLLTLFLVALTAGSFAQQHLSLQNQPRQLKMVPVGPINGLDRMNSYSSRSGGTCDTTDLLDYNTYNELLANAQSITYTGSLNGTGSPTGTQLNSSAWAVAPQYYASGFGPLTYAIEAFDSLAFANYTGNNLYSKQLRSSTITLDSLAIFTGVAADDTTPTGGLMNDSLVIRIYPITNKIISTTPAQTLSFVGYTGLQPFVVGTVALNSNNFKEVVLGVNHTFNQGQGFAVRMDFYAADTSSLCTILYGYADSCGQVVDAGVTYTSPAVPSPFIPTAEFTNNRFGNTYYGAVDSTSPTAASVLDISNGAYDIPIPGVPATCQGLYIQNWQFIAEVTVNSTLGISIADSVYTIPCNGNVGSAHALTTTRTGDLAGATYTWSTNVFGAQNTANSSFFNPGVYDVTVVNSQGCSATAEENATFANGLNLNPPTFTYPAEICQTQAVTFTNTTSNSTGYHWTFGTSSIPASGSVSPTVTYSTLGTYTVVLTLDTEGCVFATSQLINVQDCSGINNVAFDSKVSIVPNPSNGNVNITVSEADKNVTITVYNIIGQTVKAFATTESPAVFNKNMDLTDLTGGTYLVKIQSGNKIATKKLVITK